MIPRISSLFFQIYFLFINFHQLIKKKSFTPVQINGVFYDGFTNADLSQVEKIYKKLNNGACFSLCRKTLFCLLGTRLLLLATLLEDSEKTIIGMNMYYFNPRDIEENTIHEGFIGVIPEFSGQGIATQMREIAKSHFSSMGIKGISTRISINNLRSLRSAEKIGFEPVEHYCDLQTHEDRYYMICKLEEK